MFAKLVLV